METKRGISIFWLGLLGLILFPLGIIAIVLGCRQLKHKTATGWAKAGLALGITSTTLALALLVLTTFLIEGIDFAFSPPHKAVPLAAPVPSIEVHPPFETPENFVTGYNQLIQEMSEKGGLGSVDFNISTYFDATDAILQNAQRDLVSCHNLFLVISHKLGEGQAKQFLKDFDGSQLSYIRPQTLKQESENTYGAIDTNGNDVVLHYITKTGWKQKVTDSFAMDIFESVMKPLSGIFDSLTKRVQNGELKTADSIETALEAGIGKVLDEQDSSTKEDDSRQ